MSGVKQQTFWSPSFNGSIKVEARSDRLTSEAGALVVRDGLDRLGLVKWMAERLHNRRDQALITHSMSELLRTSLVLLSQGWRDQDDADTLRDDPLLRLAVSDRRGALPLGDGVAGVPEGLASQPTLSRMIDMLSSQDNRDVLRTGLLEGAAGRGCAVASCRTRRADAPLPDAGRVLASGGGVRAPTGVGIARGVPRKVISAS